MYWFYVFGLNLNEISGLNGSKIMFDTSFDASWRPGHEYVWVWYVWVIFELVIRGWSVCGTFFWYYSINKRNKVANIKDYFCQSFSQISTPNKKLLYLNLNICLGSNLRLNTNSSRRKFGIGRILHKNNNTTIVSKRKRILNFGYKNLNSET